MYQINAYDNGMYEIAPGLSGEDHEPFVFRSPAGVWYEYWIENVTAKPPPQPIHAAVPKSQEAQVIPARVLPDSMISIRARSIWRSDHRRVTSS